MKVYILPITNFEVCQLSLLVFCHASEKNIGETLIVMHIKCKSIYLYIFFISYLLIFDYRLKL